MPARLQPLHEAIHAAHGTGWDDIAAASDATRGLAVEAIELGETLCALLSTEPDALGLLALMLLCESRRAARRSPAGEFVPLGEQNTTLWSEPMTERAGRLLAAAATLGRIGRCQLEAAIQSAHAQRRVSGQTDWAAVALLYEGLLTIGPASGLWRRWHGISPCGRPRPPAIVPSVGRSITRRPRSPGP
jgi:RNA polymerase sigma-70 factor (ECF subfamily)